MDSSDWKKLNSNIQILDTKKKFYNQYYYSVKYFCPGGRIILHHTADIAEAVDLRHQLSNRAYNYGGSWRVSRAQNDQIDLRMLQSVRDTIQLYQGQLKVRVEEPNLTFYSSDESALMDVAAQHLKDHADKIVSVHRPASTADLAALGSGAILVKNTGDYEYKVFCKEGMSANKSAIYAYLCAVGDQVHMSPAVRKNLARPGDYIWGIWFYTSDPQIANMLNIIEPKFVANIHKLTVAQQ